MEDNCNKIVAPPVYPSGCTCSISSDYCSGQGSEVKCLKGGCHVSGWDCGTLWYYACGVMCFTVLVG